MTNARKALLGALVLALLLGLLLMAGTASAGPKTAFTTTLTPMWDDPAWSEGYWRESSVTAHLRDRVEVLWWESSDPRLTGRSVQTLEGDGHWSPSSQIAPERGTTTMYVDFGGGGVWESTFTAEADLVTGGSVVRGVGRGVSGSVTGLHFSYMVEEQSANEELVLTGSGNVIEP